jgi:uncharacterized protein (TIGR02246 family)
MTTDEIEIRELITTRMAATKEGDIAKVLGMMTDDVVFLVPGCPPTKKADFARAATAQTGKQALAFEGTSEVQEVTVVGDWAFMWTKLRVVANPPNGAAPIVRSGHTLSVLRKEGGKRLFARDANLLAPEQGSNSSR